MCSFTTNVLISQAERREKLEKLHQETLMANELKLQEEEYQVNYIPEIRETGIVPDFIKQKKSLIQKCKRSEFKSEEEFRQNTLFKFPDGYDPDKPEPLVIGVKVKHSLHLNDFNHRSLT